MTTADPARPDASRNASPYLYGPEMAAVIAVLDSGHYGHTAVTETFERDVAAFLGVPDAIAVTSGTAALHTALVAAGIGTGDEVIVPSLTFCATIHAILACGATPRFAEVSPENLCVDAETVHDALTDATTAVMPVLYGGRAVDLTPIADRLADRGITVIEDAAHAFGSHHGTDLVGATGALTCFSFGPIKNLTCGQGGMIIPRSPEEAAKIRDMRMLGVTDSAATRAASTGYQVTGPGFRYQMSAINAAIGSAQLARFSETARRRGALWSAYRDALADIPQATLVDVDLDHSVPQLAVVTVPDRDAVWARLHAQGIGVGVHYPPNHTQPAFKAWHRPMPVTERLGTEIMTLPLHQHLTHSDIQHVADALRGALTALGAAR
ncbi:dTDP-4-amino-4,6-dideoxygalactose transaminase [Kitasatospora sp. MAP12-15]|uniref:DegT/DnrJ/EryC1/StrS family aminotransferase n=1 Tax=unclassified Kitasatospora TaxID=2633591 RepID=UPI0024736F00|nr:DegT/DnrJ/EryC1/StrS family aminotransferase [Kitasatospora sp. MAP12-44]MDH6113698.1 dTDP-4-amino-4,6-dideoxygalactose transaminase [Kitasatospora sp. MAP12-44]